MSEADAEDGLHGRDAYLAGMNGGTILDFAFSPLPTKKEAGHPFFSSCLLKSAGENELAKNGFRPSTGGGGVRRRGTPRAGESPLDRSVRKSQKPPRTRSVRITVARKKFAQRLELHHKSKLPRQGGKMRRVTQARGRGGGRVNDVSF